jgi:hypothetical protein
MTARLLRLANRQSAGSRAGVSVTVENYSDGHGSHPDTPEGGPPTSPPIILTHEELNCQRSYLPLPKNLDTHAVHGALCLSDLYYVPTLFGYSHEIKFTAGKDNDALRVLLVKSNTKIVLLETISRNLVI